MPFNPIDAPIDYVLLAGRRSPGLAELTGWSSPRNFDERRGYGLTGATVVFRGIGLASGKLIIRLLSAEDWSDWEGFRTLVQRPLLGERARPFEIQHPILEDLGVIAVVVTDVKQPTQTGNGEWTIEIDLKEYRRPTPAISRPEGPEDRPPEPASREERGLQTLTGVLDRVQRGGELSERELTDGLALIFTDE
jgi:hypothetical protein